MEEEPLVSEPLVLPDNTTIDLSQPPPELNYPKPDFTEIVQDHSSDTPDKIDAPLTKPTFKSALQAKKRLQAFSSMRAGSLPSSPKKVKTSTTEEKTDEPVSPIKKTPKKGHSHDDKAKAVIEEIEELKREEQAFLEMQRHALKRSRSRSRSTDKGRFKKVEKKSRNYRRRSITPEKPRKSPRKIKKYPKNWREFYELDADFDVNRNFDVSTPTGNNELLRQMLFESPSLPIVPFKMKTVNREEKIVPFEYVRYTRTKPSLSYSANFGAIKTGMLSKKMVLGSLPKNIVANIENLYSNSIKFKNKELDPKTKRSRLWYSKVWKDSETECKILEKSVGLSFLQSYTGEEEENDNLEEEISRTKKEAPTKTAKEKSNKNKVEKEEFLDRKDMTVDEKMDTEEEKLIKEDNIVIEDNLEKPIPEKKEVNIKEENAANEDVTKKKKKKSKKNDDGETSASVADKKKKKKHKGKNKHTDETSTENASKKKKHKDKSKKEKHLKEKKQKRKKPKEKKKKEKETEKTPQEPKPADKLSKQQVIEELKEIEEKLAKKREEEKEKGKKAEKEKTRKRKHSEDDVKRTKHDKHRRTSEETSEEVKVEHALKTKLEKAKKMEVNSLLMVKSQIHELKKPEKHEEEHVKRSDHKKPKHSEEIDTVRKRKIRWSDTSIKEELPDFGPKVEDVSRNDSLSMFEKAKAHEDPDVQETKDNTPNTDEYHSHWESDDGISSSVPRHSLKMNRSWESDEELFERSHNRNKKPSESYADLEIPLNIKNFSRRSTNWEEKPFSVIEELKLLEEERKSLSEERRRLEVEKQKILKLQEEAKFDYLDDKKNSLIEEPKQPVRMRSSTPDEVVKVKKEKCEVNDFSIDSLNNSLLSTVSSTESNFPIAVLENEYEEFIKAVSSEPSVSVVQKKKIDRRSSSSSSDSWSSDSDHKKKKRKLKMKKKKKKKKARECEGLLLGKGNNIFNEFDIPVPSDLPEMVPTPVPVPSPILPLDKILPLTTPTLLLNSIVEEKPAVEESKPEESLDLIKPFFFSSIVLPNKKIALVDNSNLKLDDDSDSADFTDKFVKKPDTKEDTEEVKEDKEEERIVETLEVENKTAGNATPLEEKQIPEKVLEEEAQKLEPIPHPIEDIQNVPLPPEKKTPEKKKTPPLEPKPVEKETKIRRSRSTTPPRKPKDKRRSRSRSRERDAKRRSPIRRRELTPPSRRRHSSPRRRTPPRRRGSPWRRSPSPRRRSPLRRRRRSPSLSPPRSRSGGRRRSLSPRRRASPLNSPLDGFKRSVADSTISDDMLPQPNPDDYNESPNSYGGGPKYFDKKALKKMSESPQMSPKRISLDDRINQVLGLEKNEMSAMLPPPKPQETYPNYYNNAYGQQFPQYNQFGPQKPEYVQPFASMMYTQPPPPIVKPVPTPSKVLQVGNILQVVPTEEIPPPVVDKVNFGVVDKVNFGVVDKVNFGVVEKTPETSQKIVQVGNMLQIVPAIMPAANLPEPQPVSQPVPPPEKQSAESIMKQKIAERKAEREKRRQERERRRKEKEKKRKEKEKRKQMKLKIKTENMIKRAIQIETEALANEEVEEEGDNTDQPVQWPPVPVIISTTPTCKGILSQGGSKQRKSVQFADGVKPGEGTSPSGGEELSSPPPRKLPKEKRYKKVKVPKKSKKKKVRVKVVKKIQSAEEDDDDDEEDNLPPPSPPPGSPPPHVFPSRVKTHTINNVHQYVGNILQSTAPGYAYRPPMPIVMNRHQPPPGYMTGAYPTDVNSLSHPTY